MTINYKMSPKPLHYILFFAVAVRVAIFVITIIHPFPDQEGHLISPLVEQITLDTAFYQHARQQYEAFDFSSTSQKFKNFYERPTGGNTFDVSLPIFPLLLSIFDYSEGHTIYLAFFYLCLSITLCWVWLIWLSRNQLPQWSLWLFAMIPNPIFFMLAISTDMLFALFFAIFFILYFKNSSEEKSLFWILPLLAMVLTRPNGISVLLFVLWDNFYLNKGFPLASSFRKRINIALFIMIFCMAILLMPYFLAFLISGNKLSFFNISSEEYIHGLFTSFPIGINQFISWVCLAGAKILYFVGLRPSYGDIPLMMLLIRAGIGLLLLPGIIYLIRWGDKRHKILFYLYFLPVFLGASQDRYNLPLQPLLYYYGVLSIVNLRNRMSGATKVPTCH